MVSGFVTSPCDQHRIRSGAPREIRMALKLLMMVPRSNGLERYKGSSVSFRHSRSGMTRKTAFAALTKSAESKPAGLEPQKKSENRGERMPGWPAPPLNLLRPPLMPDAL